MQIRSQHDALVFTADSATGVAAWRTTNKIEHTDTVRCMTRHHDVDSTAGKIESRIIVGGNVR
ncbi:MAG: hypothetical protein OEN01_03995 [Candidatus Krumholzibacteria bacterium]|nr:hypothetical protein [Candidatus Krumholzibacteria bacterium]